MKEIISTITKPLAVLGENDRGYTKRTSFRGTATPPSSTLESGIQTTNAAARVSRSTRTRAEIFMRHLKQFTKRNNPFSAGNRAFGNGRPYFFGGR